MSLSDRRRNLGPTDQVPFTLPNAGPAVIQEPTNSLKPIFLSQGIAMHATGSAYMEVGDLKLHATVHGPQQLRGEFSAQAEVEVNVQVQNFSGIQNKEDVTQGLSDFVRSSIAPAIILKEYPKSRIVISLAVISGREGAPQIAAAVNVVTMALVNAGIALHDMVTAVSVSKTNSTSVYVDADFDENTPQLKQIVAACSVSTNKLLSMLVTSHGEVSRDDLKALLDRAGTASKQLRQVFDAFLVEDYDRLNKQPVIVS